jgi:hypothetical protein
MRCLMRVAGSTGGNGAPGKNGVDGRPGFPGAAGRDGARGLPGKDGETPKLDEFYGDLKGVVRKASDASYVGGARVDILADKQVIRSLVTPASGKFRFRIPGGEYVVRISDVAGMDKYRPRKSAPRKSATTSMPSKPDGVVTEKGLSEIACHHFVKANITALNRMRKTDINRIGRAVGAAIVGRTDETREDDIATECGLFETVQVDRHDLRQTSEGGHKGDTVFV